ncbi:DUF3570 domain-containing protein [Nannocystis sp. ncelm1]|uniref:DUF3570 domain-containing protein n=1 Tax=Nannocystis radixulma TaxID=2995305 RepID=A0ABT5BC46_9BACT|nr:DUF3570 domain-containing protein [Nannocystis radixulma]
MRWIPLSVALLLASEPSPIGGQLRGGIYVRTDSDRTTVISPRAHVRQQLGSPQTNLDITYSLDAWTSASVDIRTAATPIVRENRHEGVVGVERERGNTAWSASYRFSHEPDYVANSATLGGKVDLAQRTITLAGRLFGALDRVGRSGDPTFREPLRAGGALVSATFVVTKTTLLQFAYELRGALGYQASPYRFVAVGGGDGLCNETTQFCLPEVHPRRRNRHAWVLRARQALHRKVSLGATYRFYYDSWQLRSHTAAADLTVMPTRGLTLSLEYRLYAQSSTFFYRARYMSPGPGGYFTRDRELSSLGSQRLALHSIYNRPLKRGAIEVGALVAGSRIGYDDFVGLSRVWALELSAMLGGRY